jgi:outer membrane protein TolC
MPPPRPQTGAAQAPADGTSLRLDQAVALALSRHPRLLAVRHQATAAEAQVGVAKSRYYPQVNVWLQYLRGTENANPAVFHSVPGVPRIAGSQRDNVSAYDSFNNYHAALTVHQLLHDFGRTQGEVAAQKAFLEAAKMNERLVEQEVAFGVARAYYDVLAGRETARVADEGLTLAQRVLELAAAGQQAGLRHPSEKARAEADVATAEVAKIEALAALDVARARFANALGQTDGSFEPAGEEATEPSETVEAAAIAQALRNRPELRALELQRQALSERMKSVRAGHYPRVEAIGVLQSRGQFLGGESFDYAGHNWSAGVVVHVPVFQGFLLTEQEHAIQAQVQSLESAREGVRQAVVLEVKQALAQVRSADQAQLAAQKAVEAAQLAYETSEGRYRSGLTTLLEMTDAQTAYVSALAGAVRASYNRRFARAALGLATGTLATDRAARSF